MDPSLPHRGPEADPPRARLLHEVAYTWTLVLGGFAGFGMVYGATNIVTSLHSVRVPVHLDVELAIPFVPAMTVLYGSLYLMVLLTPFVLRTRREVLAFFSTFWAEVAIAAVFFLAVPAESAYPPHPDAGAFRQLFEAVDALSMSHNMFPSLHVTFAVTAATVFGTRGARSRWLFGVWAAGICASTVLTHQHHLIDVAGGLVLAWICLRRFYFGRHGDGAS